MMKEIFLK